MSNVHGRLAEVYYNALKLERYLTSMGLSVDVDAADTSVFGDLWKTAIPGQMGATFSTSGLYDPTAIEGMDAALGLGTGVLTHCPGGAAANTDQVRLFAVTDTSYAQSDEIAGAVAFDWEALALGAVAFGTAIHPYAKDTNTTTGTAIDQTAATSLGWTAHLHVTAVDGGSWVVTIEDSADGSTGWATIATFAAKTAAGAERLLSASATTTARRWVRVVATRTGGSVGHGLTYVLAFARTRAS